MEPPGPDLPVSQGLFVLCSMKEAAGLSVVGQLLGSVLIGGD